jgi:hypothetical protein
LKSIGRRLTLINADGKQWTCVCLIRIHVCVRTAFALIGGLDAFFRSLLDDLSEIVGHIAMDPHPTKLITGDSCEKLVAARFHT